ncbi:hydantoinase B/oxoprolinase family protein [Microbacterium sp.]|uniref:hydantoinase B/oxoprolinase family protein n=1 Tax=Microbacterium sp. TaxID=51671 RepID=UPI003A954BBE
MDAITLSVLSSKLDTIVREMSNTLLRSGRSTVLTTARDFSCAIVSSEDELLATAEGLPVHVVGAAHQAATIKEHHPGFSDGDAFLHNDPYTGNTHAADHTILVPVFVDGEHFFTTSVKAHQADAGNSVPSTYVPFARDVYHEGALIFPCVQVQRDFSDIDDIIRMCRSRIRVPEQWYGDYLALVGAARTGERRLQELVRRYGKETVRAFVTEWFDYSERRMIEAIKTLPAAQFHTTGRHDPIEVMPDGIPLDVRGTIDPDEAMIVIDLTNNIDCIPAGLNSSMVCSINNATAGIFNCLDSTIPHNEGSLRRIRIDLRENCVVGIPRFPHSTSMATTNLGDRLVSLTQMGFAQAYDEIGLAEGAGGLAPGMGVISGNHPGKADQPFISQIFLGSQGGPGTATNDGWLVFSNPAAAGLLHRDSVELDEQRYPILVEEISVLPDSEGAGTFRGAHGVKAVFGPIDTDLTVAYTVDHHVHPPAGVRGGGSAGTSNALRIDVDGTVDQLPLAGEAVLKTGQRVISIHSGGGGYGPPTQRDVERIAEDVAEGLVSPERARQVYGYDPETGRRIEVEEGAAYRAV